MGRRINRWTRFALTTAMLVGAPALASEVVYNNILDGTNFGGGGVGVRGPNIAPRVEIWAAQTFTVSRQVVLDEVWVGLNQSDDVDPNDPLSSGLSLFVMAGSGGPETELEFLGTDFDASTNTQQTFPNDATRFEASGTAVLEPGVPYYIAALPATPQSKFSWGLVYDFPLGQIYLSTRQDPWRPGISANAALRVFGTLTGCEADTDDNGTVDLSDVAQVLADFGRTGSGQLGDVNRDENVDLSDLAEVLARFGQSCD